MAYFYLDTSALAKRYVSEVGSAWIRGLINPASGNVTIICDLTPVEFSSLLARRQRAGELSAANATLLQIRFLADVEREYLSLPIDGSMVEEARRLVSAYPLRTLDAVQLAGALEASRIVGGSIRFIGADVRLLNAAQANGLLIDNPNSHP